MEINRQACLNQWAFIDEFSAKHQAANQIFAAEMMVTPTIWGRQQLYCKAPRPRRAEDLLHLNTERNPLLTDVWPGFIDQ
jgi:hypothetical protein